LWTDNGIDSQPNQVQYTIIKLVVAALGVFPIKGRHKKAIEGTTRGEDAEGIGKKPELAIAF
jgi:hypothetical protein